MISEGTPAEVRRYLSATRFDLSKLRRPDLPQSSTLLYRTTLDALAACCTRLGVQAVVEIVYTDAAKSEAIVGNQGAVIVHDRYLGQILQMMNRLFLYGCSPKSEMIYFHKVASHVLSRYGFYREAIFAAQFYASRRGEMDVVEKSKGQHLHGLYTILQEMVVVFHEYGHILHRRASDRIRPLREAVEEWILQYSETRAAPRTPEENSLIEELIGKEGPISQHDMRKGVQTFDKGLGDSVAVISGRADLVEELVCDAFAISATLKQWREMKLLSSSDIFKATVMCFLNLRALGSIEQCCASEPTTDPKQRETRQDGDWNESSTMSGLYFALSHMRVHHAKMCAILWLECSAEEEQDMRREAISLMNSHTDNIFSPASATANILLYSKEVRSHLENPSLKKDFWAAENQEMQRTLSAILHGVRPR